MSRSDDCWASSTSAIERDFSLTSMTWPGVTRYEAMSTFLPSTVTWPWLTNWRAAQGVGTNLAR